MIFLTLGPIAASYKCIYKDRIIKSEVNDKISEGNFALTSLFTTIYFYLMGAG